MKSLAETKRKNEKIISETFFFDKIKDNSNFCNWKPI